MKKLSLYLLSAWLILTGLIKIFHISFASDKIIMAVLGLAAGVSIIVDCKGLALRKNPGTALLAVWLIAQALFTLIHLNFQYRDVILAGVGLAAGIALIIKR